MDKKWKKFSYICRCLSKLLWGNNWSSELILHHHHGRIMIDFIDPLIVAERIATTDSTRYLTIGDINDELRDGEEGVSGVGTMGKRTSKIE